MKETLHIVKIGGNIINKEDKLREALVTFGKLDGKKILIHGGGKSASNLEQRLGLQTKMIDGRRITDKDSLEVVVMTYAGLINKNIVAKLQSLGHQTIGLTGADLDIIKSKKRSHSAIDYGFVGDIISVQTQPIIQLLNMNALPVLCAITHDKLGLLLNTNADTVASEVAQALADDYKVNLKYVFEYSGVLKSMNDAENTFPSLDQKSVEQYKNDGTLSSGMLPKISNALNAKSKGVSYVSICSINNLHSQIGATEII